jgi:alanine dehydrogenase
MRISIPREIKNNEYRVAITPAGVHDLVANGHEVHVERGAGEGSSIADEAYADAGAIIEPDAASTWASAQLLLKVKEPIESEFAYFREGLVLFAYLHLAAEPKLTTALMDAGVIAIAYETVQRPDRSLPLLAPMSEVAGRLAPIVGANALLKPQGGSGLLVPGVPGTYPAKVVVLGGGVAGTNAASVAVGLGADVTVLDTNVARLRELDALYAGRIKTVASTAFEVERAVLDADLVIGSVLVPGARAPKLVRNDMVAKMRQGSVLVDIAVDQGGCFEDSYPTTHDAPTFRVHDCVFYCVANMPGAVPHTSTHALTNATLPYLRAIANNGWKAALRDDASLALGLNVAGGAVTNAGVADANQVPTTALRTVLD